ncbi:MAG: hypothetical protein ACLR23_05515 [Clostridia bacterium]
MKTYTGTITGEEELLLPFVNVYQAEAEPGSLTVQKEVVGDNPDPDKEFSFAITFSDGGTYEYTVDGGEPQELISGGLLVLKSGQTAVFTNLPDGIPLHCERNRRGRVSSGDYGSRRHHRER